MGPGGERSQLRKCAHDREAKACEQAGKNVSRFSAFVGPGKKWPAAKLLGKKSIEETRNEARRPEGQHTSL